MSNRLNANDGGSGDRPAKSEQEKSDDFFDAVVGHLDYLEERFRPPAGEISDAMKLLLADLRPHAGSADVDDMIANAEREMYHDFLSPLDCPIVQLVEDAYAANLKHIVKFAKQGKYDASFN